MRSPVRIGSVWTPESVYAAGIETVWTPESVYTVVELVWVDASW